MYIWQGISWRFLVGLLITNFWGALSIVIMLHMMPVWAWLEKKTGLDFVTTKLTGEAVPTVLSLSCVFFPVYFLLLGIMCYLPSPRKIGNLKLSRWFFEIFIPFSSLPCSRVRGDRLRWRSMSIDPFLQRSDSGDSCLTGLENKAPSPTGRGQGRGQGWGASKLVMGF